jgi:hypothetical protein
MRACHRLNSARSGASNCRESEKRNVMTNQKRRGIRAVTLLGLSLAVALPALGAGQRVVTDVDGERHRLADGQRKATVLVFVTNDCPIANRYAPEINRLHAEYAPRGVAFFVVYADPGLADAEVRKHAREFGFRCPVVRDAAHSLVRLTGATVTPEAAVLGRDGALRYRGRIDDRCADFGKWRPAPTRADLRLTLDAILKGKPVPAATARPVGCFIPPAP